MASDNRSSVANGCGQKEYVPMVMAICMVESGGRSVDIMQCSEEAPLTHNIRIVRGALLQQNTPFRLALERLNPYWTWLDAMAFMIQIICIWHCSAITLAPAFTTTAINIMAVKYTEQAAQQFFSLKMRKKWVGGIWQSQLR